MGINDVVAFLELTFGGRELDVDVCCGILYC
jgi:hypothetical protein